MGPDAGVGENPRRNDGPEGLATAREEIPRGREHAPPSLTEARPGKTASAGPALRELLRGALRSRAARFSLAIGLLLLAAILAWYGVAPVGRAFRSAGPWLIVIVLLHVPPMWADAMGWRCLLPREKRPRRRTMVWARWIGESINELLPVLQMGGNVAKAWLLAQRGRELDAGQAGASVVVDVTLVVLSQIFFTLIGLVLLVPHLEHRGDAFVGALTGACLMAALLAGFYFAQRRGLFGFVVRASRRILGRGWIEPADGASAIDNEVMRLYGKRRAVLASGAWHFFAWTLGVGEIWLALRIFGKPVDFETALLLESLGQAIRTGAFAVPGALGVQEGGYVLVGAALGVPSGMALALSLVRRVRDLLLGIPGLLAWQRATLHMGGEVKR